MITTEQKLAAQEWRPVIGYEELYEVSNDGLVRSKRRRNMRGYRLNSRILRPGWSGSGHLTVVLYKNRERLSCAIHRLVLEAFKGQCPDGMECCHYDGDPANNRFDNLRWDARSANCQDTVRHGRSPRAFGEVNGRSKLTTAKVEQIFALRRTGRTHRQIATDIGTTEQTVYRVLSGQSWRHVTAALAHFTEADGQGGEG